MEPENGETAGGDSQTARFAAQSDEHSTRVSTSAINQSEKVSSEVDPAERGTSEAVAEPEPGAAASPEEGVSEAVTETEAGATANPPGGGVSGVVTDPYPSSPANLPGGGVSGAVTEPYRSSAANPPGEGVSGAAAEPEAAIGTGINPSGGGVSGAELEARAGTHPPGSSDQSEAGPSEVAALGTSPPGGGVPGTGTTPQKQPEQQKDETRGGSLAPPPSRRPPRRIIRGPNSFRPSGQSPENRQDWRQDEEGRRGGWGPKRRDTPGQEPSTRGQTQSTIRVPTAEEAQSLFPDRPAQVAHALALLQTALPILQASGTPLPSLLSGVWEPAPGAGPMGEASARPPPTAPPPPTGQDLESVLHRAQAGPGPMGPAPLVPPPAGLNLESILYGLQAGLGSYGGGQGPGLLVQGPVLMLSQGSGYSLLPAISPYPPPGPGYPHPLQLAFMPHVSQPLALSQPGPVPPPPAPPPSLPLAYMQPPHVPPALAIPPPPSQPLPQMQPSQVPPPSGQPWSPHPGPAPPAPGPPPPDRPGQEETASAVSPSSFAAAVNRRKRQKTGFQPAPGDLSGFPAAKLAHWEPAKGFREKTPDSRAAHPPAGGRQLAGAQGGGGAAAGADVASARGRMGHRPLAIRRPIAPSCVKEGEEGSGCGAPKGGRGSGAAGSDVADKMNPSPEARAAFVLKLGYEFDKPEALKTELDHETSIKRVAGGQVMTDDDIIQLLCPAKKDSFGLEMDKDEEEEEGEEEDKVKVDDSVEELQQQPQEVVVVGAGDEPASASASAIMGVGGGGSGPKRKWNTALAYYPRVKHFVAWCQLMKLRPIPHVDRIAAFLAYRLSNPWGDARALSLSTFRVNMAALQDARVNFGRVSGLSLGGDMGSHPVVNKIKRFLSSF